MDDETESGASLLARREYARAVPLLQQELEKYPTNLRISLQYADALSGAGRAEEAFARYESVARYHDDNGRIVQAAAVRRKGEKLLDTMTPAERHRIHASLESQKDPPPEPIPPAPAPPKVPPERNQVIAAAEKLVAKGKIVPAIEEYSRLLEARPNDVNTLNRIGDLWVRINRNEEAVQAFAKIAELYARDGYFLQTIAIRKKIAKLDPSSLENDTELAGIYEKQGLVMEAKRQYQIVADDYVKRGEIGNAIGIYREISRLDRSAIEVHVTLAGLYARNHQTPEALEEYDRIGHLLLQHGKIEEALEIFHKVRKLDPGNLALAASHVASLVEASGLNSAAQFVETTLETEQAALISEFVRNHTETIAPAMRLLETLLARHPDALAVREALAGLYLRENNADSALAVLKPVVDRAMERADIATATQLLNRILDVEVFHVPTREKLAEVEIAGAREDGGIAPPPLAPGQRSLDADAHEERGRSLLAEHEYREAADALNAAAAADPGRTARIGSEFGFLPGSGLFPLSDAAASARLRWCTDVWRTLTRGIDPSRRCTTGSMRSRPMRSIRPTGPLRKISPSWSTTAGCSFRCTACREGGRITSTASGISVFPIPNSTTSRAPTRRQSLSA